MALTTGIEIELLLPEGMGRLDLLDLLAARFSWTVEPFLFPSKVPVPEAPTARETLARIEDIARHHQARVHSVAPDYRHFYLVHRAGRIRDARGELQLSVVHDNTLPGGERVAEVVTRPFREEELPWLDALLGALGGVEGVTLPPQAALHVHADGAAFQDASRLARLVELYGEEEAELRAFARTPEVFKRAKALPEALAAELRRTYTWDAAAAVLRAHVPDRGFGLNLYNLIAGEPNKLTVELKLAAASLDPARVRAVRARFLDLLERALRAR